MLLFKKVQALQNYLDHCRQRGFTIGFTPTMGALHQGHISLIEQSLATTDINVCSIFVNPTQFNQASDLEKYPRPIAEDITLLEAANNHILFLPSVEEIYPPQLDTSFQLNYEGLDQVLEGPFRPGHFDGVVQVVKRLLDIVQPHQLFMGQKDYQQLSIIRKLLQQTNSNTQLVMCPIVREPHGLAMSSRNVRLSAKERQDAALIHEILQDTKTKINDHPFDELITSATSHLAKAGFRPEYFSIVDGETLQDIQSINDSPFIVALAAVWVGAVRLIDNIVVKQA